MTLKYMQAHVHKHPQIKFVYWVVKLANKFHKETTSSLLNKYTAQASCIVGMFYQVTKA